MDKEKELAENKELGGHDTAGGEGRAPRARNRTVMLTPEITGQVRARLAQDLGNPSVSRSAESSLGLPSPEPSSGSNAGGFYTPQARGRTSVLENTPPTRESSLQSVIPQLSASSEVRSFAPSAASVKSEAGAVWQKKTPVVGFLVSYDGDPMGEIYELRSGRLIITSEASVQGNFLLVKDGTVSPMHAILRVSAQGQVQVLDQLSEFGTKIKRFGSDEEIELSGDKGNVEHGDIVTFGKRTFHVCMVAHPPAIESQS